MYTSCTARVHVLVSFFNLNDYRIALNFRGAQFSRFFANLGETAKFMHHENVLNLLLAATSSSKWALAGLLSKEIPTSSISTANSDV